MELQSERTTAQKLADTLGRIEKKGSPLDQLLVAELLGLFRPVTRDEHGSSGWLDVRALLKGNPELTRLHAATHPLPERRQAEWKCIQFKSSRNRSVAQVAKLISQLIDEGTHIDITFEMPDNNIDVMLKSPLRKPIRLAAYIWHLGPTVNFDKTMMIGDSLSRLVSDHHKNVTEQYLEPTIDRRLPYNKLIIVIASSRKQAVELANEYERSRQTFTKCNRDHLRYCLHLNRPRIVSVPNDSVLGVVVMSGYESLLTRPMDPFARVELPEGSLFR